MKVFLFALSLLLVSCNSSDDPIAYRGEEPVCGGSKSTDPSMKCGLPMPSWNIEIDKPSFPDNISMLINDIKVLDECSGDSSPFTLERSATVNLKAHQFLSPGNKKLKLEIFNLGSNCLLKEVYYLNTDQDFKLKGEGRNKSLRINIK